MTGTARDRLLLAALAVLLRLPTLGAAARPDEAGYLLVARQAHAGGPFLYGDLWVDRPPLLLAFFRTADALGGLLAVRVLALVAAVVLVLAAADAGVSLAGPRGGRWSGLVAAGLQASPLLGAPEVDGELVAVPLVMLSCALGLRALLRPQDPGAVPLLALAGGVGAAALLVKQNFVDALVLLGVSLLAQTVLTRLPARRGLVLLAALSAGAVVPVLLTVGWATLWGPGAAGLYDALLGFRAASVSVLLSAGTGPTLHRAARLGQVAVLTGVVPLLAVLALTRRGRPARTPVGYGLAVTLGVAVASIALGGSYWTHYLLELVPTAALAAALLSTTAGAGRLWGGTAVAAVVVSVVPAVVLGAPAVNAGGCRTGEAGAAAVSAWIRARALPDDTAVTVYGGAYLLLDAGARPGYPYLWSLPVRTLDPRLDRLRAAVSGPDAATWVVRTLALRSFGLDATGSLEARLDAGYRPVADVCGRRVLLRSDLVRPATGPDRP